MRTPLVRVSPFAIFAIAVSLNAQNPYESSADFEKYSKKLREKSVLKSIDENKTQVLPSETIARTPGDLSLEIRTIEVRLFRHHTGTLSEPLTGKEALWNTIIGEGSAGEPSSSLLIDIVVAGAPGTYENRAVELVVKNAKSGKILGEQRKSIGVLSSAGVYHTGFWLPETGCEALSVIAHIKGASSSKETRILFACGE